MSLVITSTLTLGPIKKTQQMAIEGAAPKGKATRAWSRPFTSIKCRDQERSVSLLHITFPIRRARTNRQLHC